MLDLSGLRKAFDGRPALDGLSLTVAKGETRGFVGANGAGKTTAMRIALGVLRPDAGEVRWDGRPIDRDVRSRIGYLPEERGLYPRMRARDQLVHFARLHGLEATAARDAADATLDVVGLSGRADDRVEELSLGNQQRVQIAVAVVHDPVALVLDEPFSGLDPVGVDLMADVIARRAAAEAPVLFSSHQLELVERLCDTVTVIADGRVVADGAVADLRRDAGGAEVGLAARYREVVGA